MVENHSALPAELSLLTHQLDHTARQHGEALAIIHGDTRLTWEDVARQSLNLSKALLAHGIRRGDNIALWMPNHPDWILLWLAAVRIGAAVVPINTRYKPAEAAYILAKSQAAMLVVEESFLGTDFVEAFRVICPDWDGDRSLELPDLRRVLVQGSSRIERGMIPYEEFAASGLAVGDDVLQAVADQVEVDDTIIIVFTSGTTGRPKGVMHSHNALRMMRAVTEWMGIGPQDRILGHLPLFHVAGVFSSFLPALVAGGAIVQLDQWAPTTALEVISRERVTVMSGIPTHFIDLLRHPRLHEYDIHALRTGWIGGSTIPAEVVTGVRERLGMQALLPVYGMTETTSTTTMGRPSDPRDSLAAGKGVPLGGYEVAVVDPQTRQPQPDGVQGEVAVRGYTVMKGYYRDDEATRAVLAEDGWFYTGDLGVFDQHGYLSITGRLSDKFIVGGNNVHPADIEHVLLAHPAVKQAHVVARPDDRLGEVAVAFIERVAGADVSAEDVTTYSRQHLAAFKVPRDIVFVDTWPTTPTGKIQRFRLREIAVEHQTSGRNSSNVE